MINANGNLIHFRPRNYVNSLSPQGIQNMRNANISDSEVKRVTSKNHQAKEI